MQFIYDTNGNPFALRYTPDSGTTWSTYYYMLNAQGDVVAVISGGLPVVASYTYDAWGRLVTSSGWMASINPLRYRGYYYDTETGFYYVQSRYYDPIVKRFINADDVSNFGANGEFLSYNLFAYCGNNPISRKDDGGECWHIVIGAGIGGIIGGISTALGGGNFIDIVIGTAAGFVGGALAASGAGAFAQAVGSAFISMTSNATQKSNHIFIAKDKTKYDVGDMFIDGAVGLATGILGREGASYGNSKGINVAWKQLFKRGLFNSKAQAYFVKTAHRQGRKFVLKALGESLGINSAGEIVIIMKDRFKTKYRSFIYNEA